MLKNTLSGDDAHQQVVVPVIVVTPPYFGGGRQLINVSMGRDVAQRLLRGGSTQPE